MVCMSIVGGRLRYDYPASPRRFRTWSFPSSRSVLSIHYAPFTGLSCGALKSSNPTRAMQIAIGQVPLDFLVMRLHPQSGPQINGNKVEPPYFVRNGCQNVLHRIRGAFTHQIAPKPIFFASYLSRNLRSKNRNRTTICVRWFCPLV